MKDKGKYWFTPTRQAFHSCSEIRKGLLRKFYSFGKKLIDVGRVDKPDCATETERESKDGRPSAFYYDEDAHSIIQKQVISSHVFAEAPRVRQVESVRETSRPTSTRALGLESSRVARRSTRRIGPRSQSTRVTLLFNLVKVLTVVETSAGSTERSERTSN